MKIKNVLALGCAIFALLGTFYASKKDPGKELSAIQKTIAEQIPSKASLNSLSSGLMFSSTQGYVSSNFSTSLAQFIKEHFNEPTYVDYISQNGEDLISLLDIVKKSDLGNDKSIYAYTVLRLFHEKIKAARLVDDTVIHHVMNSFPSLLGDYFIQKPHNTLEGMKQMIEQNLIATCSTHEAAFEVNPDLFMPTLSGALAQEYLGQQQEMLEGFDSTYRLRSIAVRFFEGALSKITWSRTAYESIWSSVLSISHDINQLYKSGIFDDEDDCDSLWWSLTHGFINYLDIVGSAFPLSFYSAIRDDIENNLVPFLEKEEQDDCIKTKKEALLEGLAQAEMKAYAFEKEGIFSDHFVEQAGA